MKKLTISSICLVLVFVLSAATSTLAASDEQEVLEAVKNATDATKSRDYDLMSSSWLQSPDASFFGGGEENAFLTSGWENVEVFLKAMSEIPENVMSISNHDMKVTMLSDDVALVTGYSILTFNPPDSNEQIVNHARVSNVLKKVSGKWLTVHSHWSTFPSE